MKPKEVYVISVALNITALGFSKAQWTNYAVETNSGEQSETAVCASPSNPEVCFSAWNDFRAVGQNKMTLGYAFSTNAGANWTPTVLGLDRNYDLAFDPSTVFDQNGKAYLCYSAGYYSLQSSLGRVYISRTTNNGASWVHKPVSTDTSMQDKPCLAVDNSGGTRNGWIYACWTDFSKNGHRILEKASSNGGDTWSQEFTIVDANVSLLYGYGNRAVAPFSTGPSDSLFFVQGAIPAVSPNGDLFVAWLEAAAGISGEQGSVKIRRSTDGGSTFSSYTSAPVSGFSIAWKEYIGQLRASSMPAIAIDPTNGTIYVAYTTYDVSTQDLDVFLTHSTDNGVNWSSPIRATQSSSGRQFFPALAVSPTHTLTLSYYEAGSNGRVTVWAANSYDGGNSFYPTNQQLTSSSMDPSPGSYGSDYQGVVSPSNNIHVAVWTDSRNGNFDIYSAVSSAPQPPQGLTLSSSSGQYGPIRVTWRHNPSRISQILNSRGTSRNMGVHGLS